MSDHGWPTPNPTAVSSRHVSTSVARSADDVAAHLATARAFAALGRSDLARGACNLAAVAALRMAATRSSSAFAHEVRVRRLREAYDALITFEDTERSDLAAMMEAALEREAAERVASGLAPHGRRLRGWLLDAANHGALPRHPYGSSGAPDADASLTTAARCAEACAAGDVDVVLSRAVEIIREIIGRLRRRASVEAAFDELERVALALCVDRSMSRAERVDARRSLVILTLTLRRRRSLVAAVLRRLLILDRRPG